MQCLLTSCAMLTSTHGVQFCFCRRGLQLAQPPHKCEGAWSPLGRPFPEWVGMRRVWALQRLVHKADPKIDVWRCLPEALVVGRAILVAHTEPAAKVTLKGAARTTSLDFRPCLMGAIARSILFEDNRLLRSGLFESFETSNLLGGEGCQCYMNGQMVPEHIKLASSGQI